MHKKIVLFITIWMLAIAGTVMANVLVMPSERSVIEAIKVDQQMTLKTSGDLTNVFEWVEVYYETPQADGKYVARLPIEASAVSFGLGSIHSLNFGWGDNNYLMIDAATGFPGKLIGLVQVNGNNGEGAKFGFAKQ